MCSQFLDGDLSSTQVVNIYLAPGCSSGYNGPILHDVQGRERTVGRDGTGQTDK